MQNNNTVDENISGVIRRESLIISIMIDFFYYLLFFSMSATENNLLIFLISIVIFAVSYFISEYILTNAAKRSSHFSQKISIVISALFMCFAVIWAIKTYAAEPFRNAKTFSPYLRHSIHPFAYAVILCSTTICLLSIIRNFNNTRTKVYRMLFSVLIAATETWFLYEPNFLYDTQGGAYHIEAYVISIINCLHGVPFSEFNNSIYGKYGLLYILPVKLVNYFVNNEWIAIIIIISFVGFVSFVLQNMILDRLVENDVIFFMGSLALAVPSFQIFQGVFYQVYPHRILFPTVIILCCIEGNKRNNRKYDLLIYLIVILALLWNLETGLVSGVVWMLDCIFREISQCDRKRYKVVFRNGVLLIVSVLISFALYNIGNIILGGGLRAIRDFVYPIISDKGYAMVKIGLEKPWAEYFLIISVFMAIVFYYIKRIISYTVNDRELLLVLLAVEGIGCLSYFINRPQVASVSIVTFEFVIAISFLVDKAIASTTTFLPVEEKKISLLLHDKKVIGVISSLTLVVMVLSSVMTVPVNYLTVRDTGHNEEILKQYTQLLDNFLPEDIKAYGFFVEPLMLYMNREGILYAEDFEDLGVWNDLDIKKYLDTELQDARYVLVGSREDIYVPERYNNVFSLRVDFGYGVEYKIYTDSEIDKVYYPIANLLISSGKIQPIDKLLNISNKISESNENAVNELWIDLLETDFVSEDMDEDAFIAYLFEHILGRKCTDEEYVECRNHLTTKSKKELLSIFILNQQFQDESVERYNTICEQMANDCK